jgi:hypothetical protein
MAQKKIVNPAKACAPNKEGKQQIKKKFSINEGASTSGRF